ncbi:MAG: lysine--tRNA ligase [Gammaproteobacteria bacterium]|nr:lysine--tRNA ligase [Gammaproteobacteria bacterium]
MTDGHDILAHRRAKLDELRGRGEAFPNGFERTALAAELHARHEDRDKQALEAEPTRVAVAGRIMLRRVMGKATFVTLADVSGAIQCYLRQDDLGGAAYEDVRRLWDIGDIVGVGGTLMRTNRGELTVQADDIRLLTKSLRPLPEKYHGLVDREAQYRRRHVDLIMSEDARRRFRTRTAIVREIRRFLDERDFLEVETPMMHPVPGGATARPFVTHHNALGTDLYLRIAPELYLKRLVVGGFERVYEINRSFRNEGLSTRHNPEFTMLEFYQAYSTFEDLMDLTDDLMRTVVTAVTGGQSVRYQGTDIDFARPAARCEMADAVIAHTDLTAADLADASRLAAAMRAMNLSPEPDWGRGKLLTEIFEARVEPRLVQPTFVTGYPTEVSPLARRREDDPDVTDRFEFFVAGREFANAFSEINDQDDQADRFRAQAERAARGDLEAMPYDADYVEALEYGMPPTAGEGLGIDRLVMLLTDAPSIRDVLLFPHLRPAGGDRPA